MISRTSSALVSDSPRNSRVGMSPQGIGDPREVEPNDPFGAPN